MKTIAVVDDKENILKVLKVILQKNGYTVHTFQSAGEALRRIVDNIPDVIISDIKMDDMDGKELFFQLKARGLHIPFIFMTAFGAIDDAVMLMKEGAVDYMTKPLDYKQLNQRIGMILRKAERMVQGSVSEGKQLIGTGPSMLDLFRKIKSVADTESTVLIEGESGTGKELAARAIHKASKRREKAFIPVNCSAFSENLLESELFGHEKGAFTDALRMKKGVFEQAAGGTLFLDEASELSPATQVKLLRVLQEKVFTRVGGESRIPCDVRVIAATNRNLRDSVDHGEFREDLYYRLHVIPLQIPPLREHSEDIPELVSHFAQTVCTREGFPVPEISETAFSLLARYTWPGNIRELEHLIERILILHRPDILDDACIAGEPEFFFSRADNSEKEKNQILQALRKCDGNKSQASKMLGISRRSLYYKIEKHCI